jgi:hypothetical protein
VATTPPARASSDCSSVTVSITRSTRAWMRPRPMCLTTSSDFTILGCGAESPGKIGSFQTFSNRPWKRGRTHPITTKRPVPWPTSWHGSPGRAGRTAPALIRSIRPWPPERPDLNFSHQRLCRRRQRSWRNGSAPSGLDAGNKSEREAQLQRVARLDADFHEGQGRKSPSTGRIYDRNRTSIASI